MTQLYVAYHDYGDDPTHMQLLTAVEYHHLQGLHNATVRLYVAILRIESAQAGDPLISIVAITKFDELDPEHATQIKWQGIDWLKDKGHMPK